MAVNEQTRKLRIQQALDALSADAETLRVPWKAKQERMPVVRIDLESIILNPRSHRIKSQLESDPSTRQTILMDAESDAAQEAIRVLLRATPGFEPLMQNLDDEEQKDPGIMTRQGLLVNANTRAVALRDLGEQYIEVAVLPADATLGEIYDLELDLQVAQDYRQDYSFTNELLFVEDLITEQDRGDEEVALRLRWATPTKPASIKKGIDRVRRYVRHLDLIRDIQKMSGDRIPLTDFDDAEQTLQEFDVAYEGLRNKDPKAAKRLKHARTLGLLVDLGYERQRAVNGDWVEDHLVDALEENEILAELVAPLAATGKLPPAADLEDGSEGDDPFADFDTGGDDDETPDVHVVVEELVRRLGASAREDVVKLPTHEGDRDFDRELIRSAINDAMRVAAEDAKNAAKAGNALQLPSHLLEEAAKRLTKARQTYEKVHSHTDFDRAAFEAQLGKAVRALTALEATVGE